MKRPKPKPPRFYCPGCGEVRELDRRRDAWIAPHLTGSGFSPHDMGRRQCPGGHPDPDKDRFQ